MLDKNAVYDSVKKEIDSKISTLQVAFDDLQSSLNSESKSSAGDKHETARAMAQLEQEKLGGQLNQLLTLKNVLSNINPQEVHVRIQYGSLIETNNGVFFLSVGIGKIFVNQQEIICLTPTTPIGKLLLGKEIGDELNFNGNPIQILEIR